MTEQRKIKGIVRIWGDTVGEMPKELAVKEITEDKEVASIVVEFTGGEVCVISGAKGVHLTTDEFYVKDAGRIIWQYFNSKKKTMKNIMVLDYEPDGPTEILMRSMMLTKKFKKNQSFAFQIS